MKKCPSCEKSVSEYALKCPNCGFDLTKVVAPKIQSEMSETQNVVPEPDSKTNSPTNNAVAVHKTDTKAIIWMILTIVVAVSVIAIIYYISQPLHGDDKIAYDLITNSYYFRDAHDIEVLSGDVGTKSSGKKYACLTIAYKNSQGKRVVGHYDITEDDVTDIEKALAQAKNIAENTTVAGSDNEVEAVRAIQNANLQCAILEASLSISNRDNKLNYEKITEELNR